MPEDPVPGIYVDEVRVIINGIMAVSIIAVVDPVVVDV